VEYLVGVVLALCVCLFLSLVRWDRDRAVYPVMAIIVASYYGLFAVMDGSASVLGLEVAVIAVFVLLAVAGFRSSLWYAVAAIGGHGIFDGLHGALIPNAGVPAWWPGFYLTFDVVAATWLALMLLRSRISAAPCDWCGVLLARSSACRLHATWRIS
jgi:hypothetical protein